MSSLLRALLVGSMVTLVMFVAAYVAAGAEAVTLSRILYWQGWSLQLLAPCSHIGPFSPPLCENAPLDLIAFCGGIPLGVAIYSTLAYRVLRWPVIETSLRAAMSFALRAALAGSVNAYPK